MSTETEEKKGAEETQDKTEFDLENMSEEDIDALPEEDLDKLMEQMNADESGETDKGAEDQDKAGETAEGEAKEKTDDTDTKETPAGEQSSDGKEETVETLKAKLDKANTHAEEQRVFNERQGTEVGNLRHENASLRQTAQSRQNLTATGEMTEAEKQRLLDLKDSDPIAFHREMDAIKQRDDNATRQEQEASVLTMVSSNRSTIADIVPDWEKDSAGIETYLATIIPAQDARAFVANPAQDRIGPMILKFSTDTVLERKKTATLQKKVDDLTVKLKGVQDKINTAASKKKGLGNMGTGSANAGAKDEGDVTEADINAMDGPALDEFLANQKRKVDDG